MPLRQNVIFLSAIGQLESHKMNILLMLWAIKGKKRFVSMNQEFKLVHTCGVTPNVKWPSVLANDCPPGSHFCLRDATSEWCHHAIMFPVYLNCWCDHVIMYPACLNYCVWWRRACYYIAQSAAPHLPCKWSCDQSPLALQFWLLLSQCYSSCVFLFFLQRSQNWLAQSIDRPIDSPCTFLAFSSTVEIFEQSYDFAVFASIEKV